MKKDGDSRTRPNYSSDLIVPGFFILTSGSEYKKAGLLARLLHW